MVINSIPDIFPSKRMLPFLHITWEIRILILEIEGSKVSDIVLIYSDLPS